jgi:hypothetical protein
MTSANRLRLTLVRETTPGVTPNTPRMRTMRLTGESLSFAPEYVDPAEIRDDRMLDEPIKVMQAAGGGINFELSYPVDESPLSEIYRSAFYSPWQNTPQRFNDGVADSVITGIADTTDVATVVTGDAFVAGHLVRFTGFAASANNGVFRCTTGSATVPAFLGAGFTVEAAPAATARMKVVGFEGASGDITALVDGLGSTALGFDTLGLRVGQFIKIGGAADATTFAFLVTAGAAARKAAWARITAIAANKLTLDHLPTGWAADAGTGKTVRVWFGDQIRNGVTPSPLSIERGFMGQTAPTYIVNRGMHVNELQHTIASRQKITGSATFTGMGGEQSTVPLDASPEPITTNLVMAANANVGRLYENGGRLTAPNWAQQLNFTINNNLRTQESVDESSPVGVNEGECTVTGQINTYFGSNVMLAKFYAGTPTSIASWIEKNGQAIVWQFPRATYRGEGNPNASGKNTDVMLPLQFQASKDPATGAQVIMDRLEYIA